MGSNEFGAASGHRLATTFGHSPNRSLDVRNRRPLGCYPELKTWDDGSWMQNVLSCGWGNLPPWWRCYTWRIFMEWTVIIGDWSIPMWVSWIALVVAGGLALLGLRLSER